MIRTVPDFPKPGILFYDITTLLKDPYGLRTTIDRLVECIDDPNVDTVIGIEARGFIFAPALAYRLKAGFVPVRKPRKLPAATESISYDLEYGTDTLEIHADAIGKGNRVRGFIFARALAYRLKAGFVPVRKPLKLPAATDSISYDLEYGTDTLEIHADAIGKGNRVLIADDLLSTGGTARAVVNLVERLGGTVAGLAFVVELTFLNGRERFNGYKVSSLLKYDE